ncbi:hypothetical protein NQ318_016162 [Aromia moschata]|uniref:DDE-1 domain-containing protein n=1 Tax=Aromia moschata TaxID=1265417 RepID=A0AAV8Y115_9CUCU|nr:hypothetical protein NQ318_016162 [Aromia moschata]
MDETGIQLINKPGKVVAIKGSKCVHSVTSKEKGEIISLITCNNAEGVFLPPVLIMKGVRSFDSRLNDLPPGTSILGLEQKSRIPTVFQAVAYRYPVFQVAVARPAGREPGRLRCETGSVFIYPSPYVYMNKKSSYINFDLFLKWMKEVFLPRKPEGKVLLILDDHSSHASYDDIQLANENDAIISRDSVGIFIGNAWKSKTRLHPKTEFLAS